MTKPHFKPFSAAAFKEAWLNEDLTCAEIAAQFGISTVQSWRRSKALGLPARRKGPPFRALPDDEIRAMWLAGVKSRDICRAFKMDAMTLWARVRSMALPLRGGGKKAGLITISEFRAMLLRDALAARAREEQAALLNAEMVDNHQAMRRRAA